jgi:hypothetical protein
MMDWEQGAHIASVVQAAAVIIVGVWAFFKFRKERTHHPHIDFSIDCKIYGELSDKQYIAEFLVMLKNHGYVQQKFKEIILRVRAIKYKQSRLLSFKDAPKGQGHGKSYDGRLFIPLKLIKGVDIVPEYYKPYVIEPGCQETVRYITMVPSDIKYMLVHAEYLYPNTKRAGKKNGHFMNTLFQNTVEKLRMLWYGYPNRPRTTEKLIRVKPIQGRINPLEN